MMAIWSWSRGENTYDIAKKLNLREGEVWDLITSHVCGKAKMKAQEERVKA